MRRKLHGKYFSNIISLVLFVVIAGGFSLAKAQNNILADGNPPLTKRMVERYVSLLEWSLDTAFSLPDRTAIEKQIIRYWRANEAKFGR